MGKEMLDDEDADSGRVDSDISPLVDADQHRIRPDTTAAAIEDQYLTARGGTNLREEAVTVKGRAATWESVVDEFEDYIWRQWKAANTIEDEKGYRPTSHRFTETASRDRYGRTLGADRAAQRLWDDDLTTVHVVRRAIAFGVDGQPQPPADHLTDLLAGNRAVYGAYRRHLREKYGLKFARLSILEPHRNGYAHVHDGLWVEDPDDILDDADIYPAVDAHLRAVDQARSRNHVPDAVSVETDPETCSFSSDPEGLPPTTALPRELTKYLAGFAPHGQDVDPNPMIPPVLQADSGPLRFYALLWATNRRQWRPDQSIFPHLVGASQEWFGSIEDAEDGYADPVDVDHDGGGVETVDVNARPVEYSKPVHQPE